MTVDNKFVHFTAGAISGTLGSIVTCPLDVAKTRLQSSLVDTYRKIDYQVPIKRPLPKIKSQIRTHHTFTAHEIRANQSIGFIKCLRHIIYTEGYRALYKGLLPTLVGVAPSRAIYFTTYEYCKKNYSAWINPSENYQNSSVHLLSAASAGVTCTTLTNPIWMIRTKLQLNNKSSVPLTTLHCIKDIYSQHGFKGFYKGLTASYFGVTETAIHFVIYEAIRAKIVESRNQNKSNQVVSTNKKLSSSSSSSFGGGIVDGEEDDLFDLDKEALDSPDVGPFEFIKYMGAASVSKTIATFIAYPHEVARTRMREGNPKYKTFFGTLLIVWKEEGSRGLYRGLITQLIKHIPNTAIVLATYETIIYLCHRQGF